MFSVSYAFEMCQNTHINFCNKFCGCRGYFKIYLENTRVMLLLHKRIQIVKTLKKGENRNNIAVEYGIDTSTLLDNKETQIQNF